MRRGARAVWALFGGSGGYLIPPNAESDIKTGAAAGRSAISSCKKML